MPSNIRYAALVVLIATLMLALSATDQSRALTSFFYSRCAACHDDDSPTCAGCHQHRGTIIAQADQGSYYCEDPVVITLNRTGGLQGWIRAVLYDHNGVEIARAAGPTGTGDDGQTPQVTFPVDLEATAPSEPGDYVWSAAWYGSDDWGTDHIEDATPVSIHVELDPAGVFDQWPPPGSPRTLGLAVYPNPVREQGTLRYGVAGNDANQIALEIIDPSGRRLRRLVSTWVPSGIHEVIWDGRDDAGRRLPAGTYMAALSGAGERVTRPIRLIR